MNILGTKPAPADGLPEGTPRGRDAERILAAELLAEFRDFQQNMTQFVERLAGRALNHVLMVRTAQFGANGIIAVSFGAPAGAIVVRASGHTVTVVTGPPVGGSGVPTLGTGVWPVPAGAVDTIPIGAREITLYGSESDVVSFAVLSSGPIAVAS